MIDGQHIFINGGNPTLRDGITASLRNAGATVNTLDMPDSVTPEATRAGLDSIERIDGMIILPDYYDTGFFTDSTDATWDAALERNYERAVYLSQATAQHMIAHDIRGSIVFVSTIAVHLPQMQTATLATSLAPLYPLAKMAAVDCGQYGIRVNTVTMGWIDNDWHNTHLQTDSDRAFVKAGIPLGEIGEAGAVGDACAFLMSPLARYITGATIPVDGGYSLTRADGNSPYPR